jgi:hypothetical protein
MLHPVSFLKHIPYHTQNQASNGKNKVTKNETSMVIIPQILIYAYLLNHNIENNQKQCKQALNQFHPNKKHDTFINESVMSTYVRL